jgi:hypothetical protein
VKSETIERELFLRVVSMNESSARAFGMPNAVKVVCAGQADPARYRFGAREYLLFATWADYNAYLTETK